MDQFLLFGDSLTQQAFSAEVGVFGPALADAYVRRLDVINRGFSGYNTSQALTVLPKFMPSPVQAKVRLMIIFFGANDARLPNTPGGPDQHVPLAAYKENLRAIATHPCIQSHQDIRLILVTPPPVDERQLMFADEEKYGQTMRRRKAAVTAAYAEAVRELGEEVNLPVLDLWTSMMQRTGGSRSALTSNQTSLPGMLDCPAEAKLQELLQDGLHFTRLGYQVFYDELMSLIERTWPDQMPEKLPFVLPRWDDEEVWKDDQTSSSL